MANQGLNYLATQLSNSDQLWAIPQGSTPLGFRARLVQTSRAFEYVPVLANPEALPTHLQGDAWQSLVEATVNFSSLSAGTQEVIIALLAKLSLYGVVERLTTNLDNASGEHVDDPLYLRRIIAVSKLNGFTPSVLTALVGVVSNARFDNRLSASLLLIVYHGRFGRDKTMLRELAQTALELAVHHSEPIDILRRSIALRGASFVPMFAKDYSQVWRMLDESFQLNETLRAQRGVPGVFTDENAFALTETAANVAAMTGDVSTSLAYRKKLTGIDRWNGAAWIKLGASYSLVGRSEEALSAFSVAASLGAPTSAEALYLGAMCLHDMGEDRAAIDMLLASLDADPAGISSLIALRSLPDVVGKRHELRAAAENQIDLLRRYAV
ncbi:tetratricopeptide repeat protein [Rathayibacter toxicus]|uniref:tetratricopeptide repeat protein n=1 Tax=Rathayibacter toxicus TaxID=145458 RepID=UPI0011AFE4B7|nr:tetratricopeptide repeat protein [Rathayibacter toxicus]QOD08392.1 tetratricopeptide repeat protein [Rathayibacter toxicus]QWL25191.1 tetratricopeptide repeat protein [Rathayibacter toxicus]QWL50301.1 tetratricopeptide repeat protein [Rathayibacter toxicus]